MQEFALPLLAAIAQGVGTAAGGKPVIGLQAPVGAGKTTLSRQLQQLAQQQGIRLAVASIDDAYLPWQERQQRLAGNPFGVNRVPPGSHEPEVLCGAIAAWRRGSALQLPRFDKTLQAGQGDRSGWSQETADALLLEGWMLGYAPLPAAELEKLTVHAVAPLSNAERAWLPRWNAELEAYQNLWRCCDSFWVIQPLDWGRVMRWRLQAEAKQRRMSGVALSGEALRQLVRATQASLPPQLYQAPLDARAEAVALLDGQRRCLEVRLRSRLR